MTSSLPTNLLPHQSEGALWLLAAPRAYLGDRPGMGKTRTALAAALAADARTAVICPAIVRSHWEREAAVIGYRGLRFVRSYNSVVSGGMDEMARIIPEIDTLIVDEAHYCKHTTSKRTQQIFGVNGYARRPARTWCLSGTPLPRNPSEIWPILSALWPEIPLSIGIRTRAQWVEHFCRVRQRMIRGVLREQITGILNGQQLQKILLPALLQRAPTGLPPVWWQTTMLDAESYSELTDPDVKRFQQALAAGATPQELTADPDLARYRRRVGEAKVAPLVEMVAGELNGGLESVVIFAHHRNVLHALRDKLSSFGVSYIDGQTSPLQREEELARFAGWRYGQRERRVFVGQQDACGTGLDGLQKVADRLILLEPNWVPTQNQQYAARLARTGQQSPTVVVQMVTLSKTLDEAVIRQNVRETQMQADMGVTT